MVINLVEDHNIYLCEGGPVYNGGVQPTPITYLTQWKIVGNSQVHTDPYLTSWKVSGNSVVDNNTILSCGDYSSIDNKYHIKISDGSNVYDIALTEPLRKVNDVADTIEFPCSTEGKALVTRSLMYDTLDDKTWKVAGSRKVIISEYWRPYQKVISSNNQEANILVEGYTTYDYTSLATQANAGAAQSSGSNGSICLYDVGFIPESGNTPTQTFYDAIVGKHILLELATPTTELVDAPQISVSPTDTYTSANVIPFSAFEHTENKEIWSCGEYNATDGKYHILVKPLGGSIADIALDEPLRKVNNVADTIEFPSETDGKALVTRHFTSIDIGEMVWKVYTNGVGAKRNYATISNIRIPANNNTTPNIICALYEGAHYNNLYASGDFDNIICVSSNQYVFVRDSIYNELSINEFIQHISGVELIYELATPTTELVDAPQIAEAENYTCEISQGGKAVSWSDFLYYSGYLLTDSENNLLVDSENYELTVQN